MRKLIPLHYYQVGNERIVEAKEKQPKDLVENEWVTNCGQKAPSCKKVMGKIEIPDDTSALKGQLAAGGFEEQSLTETTRCPTCSKQSPTMLFIAATTLNWISNQ